MLIIFGGLPGTGKTSIARLLAPRLHAMHLRIDTIEQALLPAGAGDDPLEDRGYRIAYALAADNLRLGLPVIADGVNPIDLTREAWITVAETCGVLPVEVEIVCSDREEHRRRVETRHPDILGHRLPSWAEVEARPYHAWEREHLVVDTALFSVEAAAEQIAAVVAAFTLP